MTRSIGNRHKIPNGRKPTLKLFPTNIILEIALIKLFWPKLNLIYAIFPDFYAPSFDL